MIVNGIPIAVVCSIQNDWKAVGHLRSAGGNALKSVVWLTSLEFSRKSLASRVCDDCHEGVRPCFNEF